MKNTLSSLSIPLNNTTILYTYLQSTYSSAKMGSWDVETPCVTVPFYTFQGLDHHEILTGQATPNIICGDNHDRKQPPQTSVQQREGHSARLGPVLTYLGAILLGVRREHLYERYRYLPQPATFSLLPSIITSTIAMAHRGESLHKDVCCIADLKKLGSSRLAPMVRGIDPHQNRKVLHCTELARLLQ